MNTVFRTILVLATFLFGEILSLQAQNITGPLNNASSQSMGGVSCAFKDIRGLGVNPASLGSLKNFQAYVFADQRFGLKELSSYSAGFALPTKSGAFGISLGRYGYSLYNENIASISYGRKLFSILSVGGSIAYEYFNVPDYGKKGLIGYQLGLFSDVSSQVSLFFSMSNPGRQALNGVNKLPGVFQLGAMYTPNSRLAIRAEFAKTLEYKEDFRFGVEYSPSQRIIIRLGGQTHPAQLSAGFGVLAFDGLIIEASSKYDTRLGYLPGIGASYGIKYR